MTDDDFKDYLFEYDHDGDTWCITIKAASEADARARMSRMSLARYVGGPVTAIAVPFGGLFARLFTRRRPQAPAVTGKGEK